MDKPIDEYKREHFREFRDTLSKLSPRMSKLKDLKGKTIQEIIAMDHSVKLQEKTINIYLMDIAAFFSWLVTEGYLEKNHATKLSIKEKKAEIDSRDPFTPEDLQLIFKSNKFQAYKNSKTPSKYWVPWIGLYTGMRLEEICQLHCADVYQIEGLWVIDINDKPSSNEVQNKKLKTENANRIIPIHNHLQKLGFLKYHADIKATSERIFPELKAYGDRKQYGKMISKYFGPFIRENGIKGQKTFHSLRHTFSDFYKKRLQHDAIFEQIFGHSHETLAGRRYGSRFSPQECYDHVISILDYSLQ